MTKTIRQFLIEQHYENISEHLEWTRDRVLRLCNAMQLTPEELGAFIRLRAGHMRDCMKRSSFPPTVELHLTLIEHSILPSSSKPPIFPNIRD